MSKVSAAYLIPKMLNAIMQQKLNFNGPAPCLEWNVGPLECWFVLDSASIQIFSVFQLNILESLFTLFILLNNIILFSSHDLFLFVFVIQSSTFCPNPFFHLSPYNGAQTTKLVKQNRSSFGGGC